jgi:predicted transcriptional regulator
MKKTVTFRMDPELVARAKGLARSENRTLTNYIETLLMRRIEAHTSATDTDGDKGEDAVVSQIEPPIA